jgi:hypothetical protein
VPAHTNDDDTRTALGAADEPTTDVSRPASDASPPELALSAEPEPEPDPGPPLLLQANWFQLVL